MMMTVVVIVRMCFYHHVVSSSRIYHAIFGLVVNAAIGAAITKRHVTVGNQFPVSFAGVKSSQEKHRQVTDAMWSLLCCVLL